MGVSCFDGPSGGARSDSPFRRPAPEADMDTNGNFEQVIGLFNDFGGELGGLPRPGLDRPANMERLAQRWESTATGFSTRSETPVTGPFSKAASTFFISDDIGAVFLPGLPLLIKAFSPSSRLAVTHVLTA